MSEKQHTPSISFRLPDLTQDQLEELAEKWGMNRTKALMICIDRIWSQVMDSGQEAATISNEGSKKV